MNTSPDNTNSRREELIAVGPDHLVDEILEREKEDDIPLMCVLRTIEYIEFFGAVYRREINQGTLIPHWTYTREQLMPSGEQLPPYVTEALEKEYQARIVNR